MIPDEAVEAAQVAYISLRSAEDYKMPHEYAQAMLQAAAPFLISQNKATLAANHDVRGGVCGWASGSGEPCHAPIAFGHCPQHGRRHGRPLSAETQAAK